MAWRYKSSAAKCPYYRGELCDSKTGGTLIYCTGMDGAETARFYYRTKEGLRKKQRQHCRGAWEGCRYAQAIKDEKKRES